MRKNSGNICNKCGKTLDIFDKQNGISVDKVLGFGSIHDGSRMLLRLCCDCTDELADSCRIPPFDLDYLGGHSDEETNTEETE